MPYEPVTSINAMANATSNSEESSLFIQNKKSLEVITERQSEFSNTMGTYARPSQRSKQSKNHSSSHTKNNGTATKGQHSSALINGSQASLNNSCSAHVNSSRYHKKPIAASGVKTTSGNTIVQSFVDITDQEMMVVNSNAADSAGGKMPVIQNHHNHHQHVGYHQ